MAAGRGARAGLGYNKAFYRLAGMTVLGRTLHVLDACDEIDEIVPVIGEDDLKAYRNVCAEEGPFRKLKPFVLGGSVRRESVYNGLKALSEYTDIVLIHDAARPFVTNRIIHAVIAEVVQFGSGVISCKINDTVKRTDLNGVAVETVNRDMLRTVQTPQAFRFKDILKAHETVPSDFPATDDASLYENMFGAARLVTADGADQNIKLTTMEDIMQAENSLNPAFRTGVGFDVHRLAKDRKLILCGVEIPHETGLLGHSDADVALHALIDAMLGAAALGDIGRLFPDTDDSFKDISSLVLLKNTNNVIEGAGYRVSNCDITIVCQRPKLAEYIDEMRNNIAKTLIISRDCVSVKATTTEHLGFEGRQEGISAQAAVMLKRNNL